MEGPQKITRMIGVKVSHEQRMDALLVGTPTKIPKKDRYNIPHWRKAVKFLKKEVKRKDRISERQGSPLEYNVRYVTSDILDHHYEGHLYEDGTIKGYPDNFYLITSNSVYHLTRSQGKGNNEFQINRTKLNEEGEFKTEELGPGHASIRLSLDGNNPFIIGLTNQSTTLNPHPLMMAIIRPKSN